MSLHRKCNDFCSVWDVDVRDFIKEIFGVVTLTESRSDCKVRDEGGSAALLL